MDPILIIEKPLHLFDVPATSRLRLNEEDYTKGEVRDVEVGSSENHSAFFYCNEKVG